MKKFIALIFTALFISSLTIGCSTLQRNEDTKPKLVDVIVLSTSTINPDLNGRPSPLKLNLYQLKQNEKFSDLNYFEITDSKALQEYEIDKTEKMLHVDTLEYMSLEIANESKYLGIVAGFQDIDNSEWKLTLLKQPETYAHPFEHYLYLRVNGNIIEQLSKEQMKLELVAYHKKHPGDERVNKRGKFKKPKSDYTKGIFLQK